MGPQQLNYELNIIPKGLDSVTQGVSQMTGIAPALQKIVGILEAISGKLSSLGETGVENVAQVNKSLIDQQTNLTKAKDKVGELDREIKKVGEDGKKSGDQVEQGLIAKFGQLGLAIQGVKGIAQGIASAIAPIFQEGMARETAAVNFTTLLGKPEDTREEAAKRGKEFADALRNSTAATLYGSSTVNDAAKNMLSFGIDDKKTQTVLAQIGDIAAGDAQKFGSLSLAFAQISSAGKLGGQDLLQLINAGFNPLNEIAKKTGKSIGELKEDMAKGLITAKDVEDAFASATSEGGQFNGMLESIKNNTLQGKLAVLQSGFDDLKAKIYEAVVPIANRLLPVITDSLIPAIMSVVDFLSPLFTLIADNIDTIGVFAGVILSVVGALRVWTGVQAVLNAVMSANPVSLIVIAIAALIALVYKAVKAWDDWGAAMTLVLGPIGMIVNLVMTLKTHWDSIVSAFKDGGILAGIKRIGIVLLDVLLKPVQQLLEMIGKVADWDWVKDGAEKIKEIRQNLDLITPGETKTDPAKPEGTGTQSDLENLVNPQTGNPQKTLGDNTKDSTEQVATGGTRNTQITINLDRMVETVNFNGTPAENAQNTVDTFTEQLFRVLYAAQTAV